MTDDSVAGLGTTLWIARLWVFPVSLDMCSSENLSLVVSAFLPKERNIHLLASGYLQTLESVSITSFCCNYLFTSMSHGSINLLMAGRSCTYSNSKCLTYRRPLIMVHWARFWYLYPCSLSTRDVSKLFVSNFCVIYLATSWQLFTASLWWTS